MRLNDLSKYLPELMRDIGRLTAQVTDNRTLLVLTRAVALLGMLTEEVKRLDKLVPKK